MTVQQEFEILCDNIRVYRERGSLSEQQRELCLSHLIDRFLSLEEAEEPDLLYRRFIQLLPDADRTDRARLCLRLTQHPRCASAFSAGLSGGGEELPSAGAHGKIALVRNRYTEEALDRFSVAMIGAKPSYAASFSDACEEVYTGSSEFCILPLENTENGRLFGFYALLDRYELRICAAHELEAEPGRIRYALIGKGLPNRLPKQLRWNFECSVATEIGTSPADILQTASELSARLLKIDSLPVLYDDGLQRFYFTFDTDRANALALDLYLSMEHARYTPIGLYPVLPS